MSDLDAAEKNVTKFGADTPVKNNPAAKSASSKKMTYGTVLQQVKDRDVVRWTVAPLVRAIAQINLWGDEMAKKGQHLLVFCSCEVTVLLGRRPHPNLVESTLN